MHCSTLSFLFVALPLYVHPLPAFTFFNPALTHPVPPCFTQSNLIYHPYLPFSSFTSPFLCLHPAVSILRHPVPPCITKPCITPLYHYPTLSLLLSLSLPWFRFILFHYATLFHISALPYLTLPYIPSPLQKHPASVTLTMLLLVSSLHSPASL